MKKVFEKVNKPLIKNQIGKEKVIIHDEKVELQTWEYAGNNKFISNMNLFYSMEDLFNLNHDSIKSVVNHIKRQGFKQVY